MLNNYQDAMAICRNYGNPDLFITFTCNVKWPEIVRELDKKPGYKGEDRLDLISRVFKMKLNDMIGYIKSGKVFGEVEARDLHDRDVDPMLYDIVNQFMIHGPCGEINRNSPCMRGGDDKEWIEALANVVDTALMFSTKTIVWNGRSFLAGFFSDESFTVEA
ncbi:unnamed protein product [Prunus brigantina]